MYLNKIHASETCGLPNAVVARTNAIIEKANKTPGFPKNQGLVLDLKAVGDGAMVLYFGHAPIWSTYSDPKGRHLSVVVDAAVRMVAASTHFTDLLEG